MCTPPVRFPIRDTSTISIGTHLWPLPPLSPPSANERGSLKPVGGSWAVNRGSLHFGSGVTRMERSNYRARQFPSRVNLWPRVNTRFVTRERRLGNEPCDVDTTADTTAATPTWWNDARGEAPPNDNGRSSRRRPPSMATDRPN